MGWNEKLLLGAAAVFFLIALVHLLRAPLRLALKLACNTALGFLALWAVNLAGAVTGVTLGLNFYNALTVAILGVPGLVLLLLIRWIF